MTGRSASSRDLLQQLDAIGARQHQVEQDQLGAVSPVLPHRDGRPAGAGRPPAGRGERVPHVAQRLRVVVDHEDARLLLHLVGGAGAARSDSGRGAVGLVNHRNRDSDLRLVAYAGALGPDAAPVGLDQPLADGQAQAVSPAAQLPVVAGEAGVLPEQVRQLLRRHAPALGGHRDRDVNAVRRRDDADGGRLGGVPRRVGEIVEDVDDALPAASAYSFRNAKDALGPVIPSGFPSSPSIAPLYRVGQKAVVCVTLPC